MTDLEIQKIPLIPLMFGVATLVSVIHANKKSAEREWIERICIGGPL